MDWKAVAGYVAIGSTLDDFVGPLEAFKPTALRKEHGRGGGAKSLGCDTFTVNSESESLYMLRLWHEL